MPRQSTRLPVPHLRFKFDHLCAQRGWSLADLAAEVNTAANTLSEYVAGVASNKSKPENTMPRDKLERFTALLRRVAPQPLTIEEARAAWLSDDKDAFRVVFRVRRIVNLAELLVEETRGLVVRANVVLRGVRGALADFDGVDRPVVGGVISLNAMISAVRFTVPTAPGSRLFCACSMDTGWVQVIPGPMHTGEITSPWESVPIAGLEPIAFKPPGGRHRFVFIQASGASLHARHHHLGLREPLGDAEIEELGYQLGKAGSGGWCWGEVVVDAS